MSTSKGHVIVNKDEVKSCAEWYVSANDKQSEVKKFHVADRILDNDEMGVSNVSDAFDRMTRSERKTVCSTDEAPKTEPKKQIEVPEKRQVCKKRLSVESSSNSEQIESKRAYRMSNKCDEDQQVDSTSNSQEMFNQAVLNGDFEYVCSALQATKNVFDLNNADLQGKTFLHSLAESDCDASHNRDKIMESLVKASAKMSTTESVSFQTPLHLAVVSNHDCFARKLIELGSQINTIDSREESPLLTALKLKNDEMAKLLLHAGASFHDVFSPRFDLSEIQGKLIADYQNQLQKCVLKTLQDASIDIKDFIRFSPVIQTSLPKPKQLCFNANIEPGFDMSNISLLLVTALVDNSDQMTTQISGETPVAAAYLNTRKLSYARETNNFIYFVSCCAQQNSVKINMKPAYVQNSKRVLVAQLIGFRRNLGK